MTRYNREGISGMYSDGKCVTVMNKSEERDSECWSGTYGDEQC